MIETLSLDYDGPDGYTLILEGTDLTVPLARLTFPIPEDVLYEFLDSPAVKAALEHRAEGETVRRERAAAGGQSWEDHVSEERDPADAARENADLIRDRARGK